MWRSLSILDTICLKDGGCAIPSINSCVTSSWPILTYDSPDFTTPDKHSTFVIIIYYMNSTQSSLAKTNEQDAEHFQANSIQVNFQAIRN